MLYFFNIIDKAHLYDSYKTCNKLPHVCSVIFVMGILVLETNVFNSLNLIYISSAPAHLHNVYCFCYWSLSLYPNDFTDSVLSALLCAAEVRQRQFARRRGHALVSREGRSMSPSFQCWASTSTTFGNIPGVHKVNLNSK